MHNIVKWIKRNWIKLICSLLISIVLVILVILSLHYDYTQNGNVTTMISGLWSAAATAALGGIAVWQTKRYQLQSEKNYRREKTPWLKIEPAVGRPITKGIKEFIQNNNGKPIFVVNTANLRINELAESDPTLYQYFEIDIINNSMFNLYDVSFLNCQFIGIGDARNTASYFTLHPYEKVVFYLVVNKEYINFQSKNIIILKNHLQENFYLLFDFVCKHLEDAMCVMSVQHEQIYTEKEYKERFDL